MINLTRVFRAATFSVFVRYYATFIVFDTVIDEEWYCYSSMTNQRFHVLVFNLLEIFETLNSIAKHRFLIVFTLIHFVIVGIVLS